MNMGAIGLPIALGIFSFAPVFMFCEVGEQLNIRSMQINDAICELDWDTFPHQVQRMMPIILLTAQNPVKLEGYGGIICCRGTFKKVCKILQISLHQIL